MGSSKQMISLCTIVKNEAELLTELLGYYDGLVDEFCVVDTGSSDGVADIEHPKLKLKRSAQFNTEQYPLDFNFADARDEALGMVEAECKWVMVLDIDYRIKPREWDAIKRVLARHTELGTDALLIPVHTQKAVIPQVVFLRADKGFRYMNAVHETPDVRGARQTLLHGCHVEHLRPHEDMPVEEYTKRHEWYLAIATAAVARDTDDWIMMTMVLKELFALKQFAKHIEVTEGFFNEYDHRQASSDILARLFLDMASSYAMLGIVEAAIERARMSLYYSPHSVSAKWTLGELYRHLGDLDESEMWFQEALASPRPVAGFFYDQPAYRGEAALERLQMIQDQRQGQNWYKDGLRFECVQGCTKCCVVAGRVLCPTSEYDQIAEAFGITRAELLEKYVDDFGSVGLMKYDAPDHPICLTETGCSIHEGKPTPCKTFPFWPQVLASPESWGFIKEKCPGIGKGKLYSPNEINKMKRQTEYVRRAWFRGFKQLRQGSSPVLQPRPGTTDLGIDAIEQEPVMAETE